MPEPWMSGGLSHPEELKGIYLLQSLHARIDELDRMTRAAFAELRREYKNVLPTELAHSDNAVVDNPEEIAFYLRFKLIEVLAEGMRSATTSGRTYPYNPAATIQSVQKALAEVQAISVRSRALIAKQNMQKPAATSPFRVKPPVGVIPPTKLGAFAPFKRG